MCCTQCLYPDHGIIYKHDLTYIHDAKNDSVVTNTIYALLNQIPYRPSYEDAVVLTPFATAAAAFTYTEDTDLTLEMTSDDDPNNTWSVSWSNVTVLEIEGGTECIGVQDFTRKYVINDIKDHSTGTDTEHRRGLRRFSAGADLFSFPVIVTAHPEI